MSTPTTTTPRTRLRPGALRALALLSVTVLAATGLAAGPAHAATPTVAGDTVVANHGFEDGTTGWTTTSSSGRPDHCQLSSTTDWASEGRQSLRLPSGGGCGDAISDAATIKTGTTSYTAFATVRAKGKAGIGLTFLDADGGIVAEVAPALSAQPGPEPAGTARTVQQTAKVPAGATAVRLTLGVSGRAEIDDVLITPQLTALGPQITKPASYLAAEVGVDADGRSVIFSVATGASSSPPQFVVTDAVTRAVRRTLPVPGGTGSWTVRQDPTTKTVYIGTYGAAALYAWNPGDDAVRRIGELPIAGAGMVYGIDHGRDGRIYGGTWGEPADGYPGAQMWTYSPTDGFAKFGPVLTTDAFYTKAVTYEDQSQTVWAATATKGHLYGCTEAGDCTDFTSLLGPRTLAHLGVYNIVANDGYVMTWGGDSNSRGQDEITVLKVGVVDGKPVAERVKVIDETVYYGPSDVHDGKLYYMHSSGEWDMYSYDLATGVETKLDGGAKVASRRWRIVDLGDPAWPGATIVGWSANGTIYRRNLTTGTVDVGEATGQPLMPTGLNSVTTGPDGRIWSAGYLGGGLGSVAPMLPGSTHSYALGGQAESMTSHRGRIYQGTYPNGRIDSFDPAAVTAGSDGVRTDCTIGSNQNRPYGTLALGDRIYYGSQADYATDVGAFGWLDLTTGACTTLSEEVGHYSVNRLAAAGGKIYGGTNIYVAYDSLPVEPEAKLLIFDEKTSEVRLQALPVPGIRSIDALTTAADGTVWAYAGGWVFQIDPATDSIVRSELVFDDLVPSGRIGGSAADLLTGPDGLLYGRAGSRIFSIDPARPGPIKDATRTLVEAGSKSLTLDRYGNLYTISGDQLIRIDPRGFGA